MSKDEKMKEFSDSKGSIFLRRTIGATNLGNVAMLTIAANAENDTVKRLSLLAFLPVLAIHSLRCVERFSSLPSDKKMQTKIDLGVNTVLSALIGGALILHKNSKESGSEMEGMGSRLGFFQDK